MRVLNFARFVDENNEGENALRVVEAGHFGVRVIENRIGDAFALDDLARLGQAGAVVGVDRQNFQSFALVPAIKFLQHRHFQDAWLAPTGPKAHEHGLFARVLRHGIRFARSVL